MSTASQPSAIYTVGHSTRSNDEFVALLAAHDIRRLVDVRTIPRSPHNPQFNSDRMPRQTAGRLHSEKLRRTKRR